MAISYIYTGQPMAGTANDDFVIGYVGSTGTSDNTINANSGDDWVLADSSNLYIPSQSTMNGSIGAAFNLDSSTQWTTDENPTFASGSTPHATAIVEATVGQAEYFAVTVGAGQSLTIDIDYGHASPVGVAQDLIVEVLNAGGTILATFDDSQITDGGLGSYPLDLGGTHSRDPFGVYVAPAADTYYIRVRPYGGGPTGTFDQNATFVLNVSVTGHALGTNSVMGADVIDGGDGDDQLFGQGGADTIVGGLGNDLIHAGSGSDTVSGGGGDDTIYGGGGSGDEIHGNGGNDILRSGGSGSYFGDAGNDLIHAASGTPETLNGGSGVDTLDVSSFAFAYEVNLATGVTNYGGESFINFENLISGLGDDAITGSSVANVIRTGAGGDVVLARRGHDSVEGGAGADDLNGGDGIDTLLFGGVAGVTVSLATNTGSGGDAEGDTYANFENITSGDGADVLTGSSGANVLRAGGGADTVHAGNGHDTVDGGSGADDLDGGNGVDTLWYEDDADITVSLTTGTASGGDANGDTFANFENVTTGSGDDVLTGSSGVNVLRGGAGADVLDGGTGNDELYGEDGDDIIDGAQGIDTMRGGLGNDFYVIGNPGETVEELADEGQDEVRAEVDYTLPDNVEDLIMRGLAVVGTGNALANVIDGSSGGDTISGLGGDDTLSGNLGDDVLIGGNGADRLIGGSGRDTLTGGSGFDVLVFNDGDVGTTRATADRITGFEQAVDLIRLRGIDADSTLGGDQNFTFIGSAAFSGVAGQLHYVHAGDVTFLEGDTDGDGAADIFIRLNGVHDLITSDFVL
jgi:Ca2+-binding RTX toxin-like protein